MTWISWSPLNLQNVLVNSLLFLEFEVNFFQLSSKQPKLVFSFLLFCYLIHFPEVFSELSALTSTTSQCQLRGRTMSPQFHLGSLYKTVKERKKRYNRNSQQAVSNKMITEEVICCLTRVVWLVTPGVSHTGRRFLTGHYFFTTQCGLGGQVSTFLAASYPLPFLLICSPHSCGFLIRWIV